MYFRGGRRTVQGERSRRDLGEPVSFSCFTMYVSIYSTCHLCPVGLGKERPGFVSMELVRGRGKHRRPSPRGPPRMRGEVHGGDGAGHRRG